MHAAAHHVLLTHESRRQSAVKARVRQRVGLVVGSRMRCIRALIVGRLRWMLLHVVVMVMLVMVLQVVVAVGRSLYIRVLRRLGSSDCLNRVVALYCDIPTLTLLQFLSVSLLLLLLSLNLEKRKDRLFERTCGIINSSGS